MKVRYCNYCKEDHEFNSKNWYISKQITSAGNPSPRVQCKKHRLEVNNRRLKRGQDYRKTPIGKFKGSIAKAKIKHIIWALNFLEYTKLVIQPCEYCLKPYSPCFGAGLDRKDSNLGYTLSNVVPCCGACNKVKNNILSYNEMKIAMGAVLKFRQGCEI